MVIYDRLIEGVVEGSECTEQEERDHWSETLKKHNARGVRVWISFVRRSRATSVINVLWMNVQFP